MAYRVTLEVYVSDQMTMPRIQVESQRDLSVHEGALSFGRMENGPADAEALEGVLTRTREFAETLTRGVEDLSAGSVT